MQTVLDNTLRHYSERNQIMVKQLAKVLAASSYEEAQKAAKDAFAELADHYDPFAPTAAVQAPEEAEAAA